MSENVGLCIKQFVALYSGVHPRQTPQPIKGPRKLRVFPLGKYGVRQSDPAYFRIRYALNVDYRSYMNSYHQEKCLENPNYAEDHKTHDRNYARQNLLGTFVDGKHVVVHVKKRPWPGHCELCGRENRKLFYHHWDDDNMSLGLWLCLRCHMFAENADIEGTTDRYIELKKSVTDSLILP